MTWPSVRPWVVLREGRLRWGGDLRRHHIFGELARRTGGRIADGWGARDIRQVVARPRGHFWTQPARVASCAFLEPEALDLVIHRAVPAVLDVQDDFVLQREALGLVGEDSDTRGLRAVRDAGLAAFRWLVAPGEPFARLAGLDLDRVIIAPNGTDTTMVRPQPWPSVPAVGMVSGAAPARGIETLIEAVSLLRAEMPAIRLLLWLVATGAASEEYLRSLQAAAAADPWIEIGTAPYERLSAELGRATVLCIPHPPNRYMDVALPVKLFDSMAAGRPLVVTPRLETARIVAEAGAGAVAGGETAADLAEAISSVLHDDITAQRFGTNGRSFVQARHEWRDISARLADAILTPRRYHPVLGMLRSR